MALAGVPMGSMYARPDGTATAKVITFGSIPNDLAALIPRGKRIATTAALLMPSVKKIDKATTTVKRRNGDSDQDRIVELATQAAVLVDSTANPKAMAPPYIKIT